MRCWRAIAIAWAVVGIGAAAHAQPPAHFAQQGPKLLGVDSAGNPSQGAAVALSADGNTAFIGAPGDDNGEGAARAWTRANGAWSQQGPKLVGANAPGIPAQGSAVAISADGNTALVGGPGQSYMNDFYPGAVWVWTRSGGTWTQQDQLIGADVAGAGARQGSSVALSADGNTALVGGPSDNNGQGAVWAWTRSNGIWTQQGPKLVATDSIGLARQGSSVALSADGNIAIVGGPYDHFYVGTSDLGPPQPNYYVGAAWIWTRSSGVWTQGAKLIGTGYVHTPLQGWSVAISADGATAITGSLLEDSAWMWTRSGSDWMQQGPKLVPPQASGSQHGKAVALSADGDIALIGAPNELPQLPSASWVWARNGGTWAVRGAKLTGSSGSAYGQGSAVALSANGRTALVGDPDDNRQQGAAWIFSVIASGDFDGDAASDRTVYRPGAGVWYSRFSNGSTTATIFGAATDIDVAADYDGDGISDVATWTPSTGAWRIVYSSDGLVRTRYWGIGGDIPIPGDVDGDGKADLVVWRPSLGAWFVQQSTGGTQTTWWGTGGDQPLLSDFDGDGKADFIVFRPGEGAWFVSFAAGGSQVFYWGVPGDVPVVGDWDGDGHADAAMFRPGTGEWFVRLFSGGLMLVQWGTQDDVPIAGDVDGDGRSDFTVWRPSNGVWYTTFAAGGTAAIQWGTAGDQPVGRVPGS